MKTIISLAIFFFIGIFCANAQGNLSITQPLSGSSLPQMGNTITVNVPAGLSVNQRLVIFIQDPTGQWWPYINASRQAGSYNWSLSQVQIGSTGNSSMTFQIQALVIDQAHLNNGISIGGGLIYISNGSPLQMPHYAIIRSNYATRVSSIVTVTQAG